MPFFRHFCDIVRQLDMVNDAQLRFGGLVALISGVVLVWLVN